MLTSMKDSVSRHPKYGVREHSVSCNWLEIYQSLSGPAYSLCIKPQRLVSYTTGRFIQTNAENVRLFVCGREKHRALQDWEGFFVPTDTDLGLADTTPPKEVRRGLNFQSETPEGDPKLVPLSGIPPLVRTRLHC